MFASYLDFWEKTGFLVFQPWFSETSKAWNECEFFMLYSPLLCYEQVQSLCRSSNMELFLFSGLRCVLHLILQYCRLILITGEGKFVQLPVLCSRVLVFPRNNSCFLWCIGNASKYMLEILQKQFWAYSILCQSSSIFSLTSFMSKQCLEGVQFTWKFHWGNVKLI